MTHKEKFIKALKREPITGHVPHFELVFFLTMEAFGKVHPTHRHFGQWGQMSEREKTMQIEDAALTYVETAKKYDHSAIFPQGPLADYKSYVELLKKIKEFSNGEHFIMIHGDPTFAIPNGDTMVEESVKFYEEPEEMHQIAAKNVKEQSEYISRMLSDGAPIDGIAMCSDYCFNDNPFLRPELFAEFITPYLAEQIEFYHNAGLYVIKHADGNILPIVDQIVSARPDALHSIDPQGGVDLKDIKARFGDKVCLIGNVNCGLLQTGTEEEVVTDVMRALHDGMPGYGYIFSTSNCAYTGLSLKRYEMMHKLWREHGRY